MKMKMHNIVEKLDMYLTETSQSQVLKKMGTNLGQIDDVVMHMGMAIWHYMIGKGTIYKTKNAKTLIDELWDRIGKPLEYSERLTNVGMKQIKKNFYSLSKEFKDWKFDGDKWIK